MRFKNRYILLQLVWKDGKRDDSLTEGQLLQHIRDSLQLNFGDFRLGSALPSVSVKYLSLPTGLLVVRCGREELPEVLGALTLITDINKQRVIIRSLHTAGTVQGCREVALKYHDAAISELRLLPQHHAAMATAGERLEALEM